LEIKGILSVIKKNRILFFLGAVGLILLLFGGTLLSEKEKVKDVHPTALAEEYRASLEADLARACTSIRGVGEARVILTLASTEIAVYEKNVSGESETVASSGGEALLLSYRMPKVAGVAVLCEGGDNITVKEELHSFLRAVLGLSAREIHIAALK
jgi:stage III sporulation protein AG